MYLDVPHTVNHEVVGFILFFVRYGAFSVLASLSLVAMRRVKTGNSQTAETLRVLSVFRV